MLEICQQVNILAPDALKRNGARSSAVMIFNKHDKQVLVCHEVHSIDCPISMSGNDEKGIYAIIFPHNNSACKGLNNLMSWLLYVKIAKETPRKILYWESCFLFPLKLGSLCCVPVAWKIRTLRSISQHLIVIITQNCSQQWTHSERSKGMSKYLMGKFWLKCLRCRLFSESSLFLIIPFYWSRGYMVQNMMSCNMHYVFTAQKCTIVEI